MSISILIDKSQMKRKKKKKRYSLIDFCFLFERMRRKTTKLLATAGIFLHPKTLLKMLFERMKALFLEKNSSLNFIIFPKFKNFMLFFAKLSLRWKKDILKKHYHLIRIVQQICNLHRTWKNSSFFIIKTHLL